MENTKISEKRNAKVYTEEEVLIQILGELGITDSGKERIVPSAGLARLRETFRKNAGNLVFRTIERVVTSEPNFIGTMFYEPEEDGTVTSTMFPAGSDLPFDNLYKTLQQENGTYSLEKIQSMCKDRGIPILHEEGTDTPFYEAKETLAAFLVQYEKDRLDELMERQVEKHYSKFFCFTSSVPQRPDSEGEKRVGRNAILLDSKNYSQIDFFENMDFRFKKEFRGTTVIPRSERYVRKQKCTDIACIHAVSGNKTKGPEAVSWFICSPQFMRMWTLIMYEKHETFSKISDTGDLRRKVFSGNYTITNSYLGWLHSCHQNQLVSDISELRKRFWNLRTEHSSVLYMHVYSALVLMLRYNELPGPYNIPNKLDNGPHMHSWNLPDNWIQNLLEKYQIGTSSIKRKVELNVPSDNHIVPFGTREMTEEELGLPSTKTPVLDFNQLYPSLANLENEMKADTVIVETGPLSPDTFFIPVQETTEGLMKPSEFQVDDLSASRWGDCVIEDN